MNWLNFQEDAIRLTEEEVAELTREVVNTYKQAIVDIKAQIKEQYATLAGVKPENYYNELVKYDRLETLLDDVTASYRNYSLHAQLYTEHAVSIAASNAFYRSVFTQSWIVDQAGVTIPYDLVELIVYGSSQEWKAIPLKRRKAYEAKYGKIGDLMPQAGSLTDFLVKNRNAEIAQIRQAISAGIKQGLSYNNMAASIVDVIGTLAKNKDGTINASGAFARAVNIISTESTRAMNAGAYAATKQLESQGINVQKRWLATLDSRTRSSHAHLDHTTIDVDDRFWIGGDSALYPGGFSNVKNNARCRCSTIDIIDGEDPALRTGRNPTTGEHETFDYKTFDQWAKDTGLKRNKYGELFA